MINTQRHSTYAIIIILPIMEYTRKNYFCFPSADLCGFESAFSVPFSNLNSAYYNLKYFMLYLLYHITNSLAALNQTMQRY